MKKDNRAYKEAHNQGQGGGKHQGVEGAHGNKGQDKGFNKGMKDQGGMPSQNLPQNEGGQLNESLNQDDSKGRLGEVRNLNSDSGAGGIGSRENLPGHEGNVSEEQFPGKNQDSDVIERDRRKTG